MTDRCPKCGRAATRSTEANRRYWAIVTTISEKLKPEGKTYSPEVWHTYLRGKFLGQTDIQLPNGRTVTQPNSTAKLDKSEFNEYMTQVEVWAAEHGAYLAE